MAQDNPFQPYPPEQRPPMPPPSLIPDPRYQDPIDPELEPIVEPFHPGYDPSIPEPVIDPDFPAPEQHSSCA